MICSFSSLEQKCSAVNLSVGRKGLLRVLPGVCLLLLLLAAPLVKAALLLDLKQLQWGQISVAQLQLQQPDAAAGEASATWRLRLRDLSLADVIKLDIELDCHDRRAPDHQHQPGADGWSGNLSTSLLQLQSCRDGVLRVQAHPTSVHSNTALPSLTGSFSFAAASGTMLVNLPGAQLRLTEATDWSLQLQSMPLAWLQQVLHADALTALVSAWSTEHSKQLPWPRAGTLSGTVQGQWPGTAQAAMQWQARLQLQALELDNAAGDIAAAGVALDVQIEAEKPAAEKRWTLRADAQWRAGEWLFGAFYLPAPAAPVSLDIAAGWLPASDTQAMELKLQQLHWQHDQVLELQAAASWRGAAQNVQAEEQAGRLANVIPQQWQISKLEVMLPAFQDAYLNGWLQTQGMADLIQSGTLELESSGQQLAAGLRQHSLIQLTDVQLEDPGGRLAASGLAADIDWQSNPNGTTSAAASQLSWQALQIRQLPFAATTLDFTLSGQELQLQRDSMIPVLDGGIVLHNLHLQQFLAADGDIILDAEIVPISLGQLAAVMGWPAFAGELSGSIPGISREQGIWTMNGQIELALFQGRVVISGLSLERPLGVLPVLQASVWAERLQLEPLTEVFDVGRITGPIDAYVRDLRLLDWQPVSFNAWLQTSAKPKVPLRISQRAVDTLSSVGGGIGSGLQASVLRLFESFRYQRLGLSCQLSYGICAMDGIEDAADGQGFLLVKGGGLPHLDVVAYNRRVDWERLLTQMRAAIESEGAKVQ